MTLPVDSNEAPLARLLGWARPRLEPLVPVDLRTVLVRQRPAVVTWLWIWSVGVASPLALAMWGMVRHAYGSHPRGDGVLWNPGAFELVDLAVRVGPTLAAITAPLVPLVAMAAAFGGLVLDAAVMTALAFRNVDDARVTMAQAFGRSIALFRPALVLRVSAWLLEGLLCAVGVFFEGTVSGSLTRALGDARAEAAGFCVVGLAMLLASGAGVVFDLARASLVCDAEGALVALATAMRAWTRAPVHMWAAWGWRAALALGLVALGSAAAQRLGKPTSAALAALVFVHQGILLGRAALHVSWLAYAVRALPGPRSSTEPAADEAA